jgi:RND family efflux transporter MFP subunit
MDNPYGRPLLSRREKVALTVAGIVLLAISLGVASYMMATKPRPQRTKPAAVVPVVKVMELLPTSQQVTVPVQGTVVPALQVDLKARVSGEVIWTSEEFVEGGIVKRGQALVKIDPIEYELALVGRKAVLQTAMLDLKTEQGRQEIARSEWEILGLEDRATEMDRELALRQPQLAAFEAKLEAAKAEVKQAELHIERTVIRSPFNGVIRATSVDLGSQVTVQGLLAELAGTDAFHVEALVPLDRLAWIHIPDGPGDTGSRVSFTVMGGRVLKGRIFKLLTDLQPNGRLARVLIEVSDPLDLLKRNGDRRPLLLGDYVSATIEGRTVESVFVISREHLKDGGRVYTVDSENRLRMREVEIVWSGMEQVLVRGLEPGTQLIVSDLPAPMEGMKLLIQGSEQTTDAVDTETRRRGDAGK